MEGHDDEGEEGKEGEEENGEEEKEVGRRVRSLRSMSLMRVACAVAAVLLLVSSTAALAVTITNRDDQDHKVTVVEGETKTDHMLKPAQVLQGICAKGCTIRLNDDEEDEYQLEADDVVSIEEGSLYYDNLPEAPAAPAPATGGPKAGQKG
jgi:translation initiation factor 1 (eIF-1/SUI1)